MMRASSLLFLLSTAFGQKPSEIPGRDGNEIGGRPDGIPLQANGSPPSVDPQDKIVNAPAGAQGHDGCWIVSFAKGRGREAPPNDATEVRQLDIINSYSACNLNQAHLDALSRNPNIMSIEQVQTVQINEQWNLDRADQRILPLSNTDINTQGLTGSGVKIYVVDTGLDTAHSEFTGRFLDGYSAIGGSTADCNGHGTHVSGTAMGTDYGVAKGAYVVPVRVLDCSGSGTNTGVIAGINWAVQNFQSVGGLGVISMSLGGGISTALDDAVKAADAAGIPVVVAAGNSNADACTASPARAPNAITVGATDSSDTRASFSNFGTCVDIFAPGVSVESAKMGGGSIAYSGTSMATPQVSGLLALYLQELQNTASAKSKLISSATTGVVINAGTGSPNLLSYLNPGALPSTTTVPPTTPPTTTHVYEVSNSYLAQGSNHIHKSGTYWTTSGGTIQFQMTSQAGTDFDIYLYKWLTSRRSSYWSLVAKSETTSNVESILYTAGAGSYYLSVNAFSGSGYYNLFGDGPGVRSV